MSEESGFLPKRKSKFQSTKDTENRPQNTVIKQRVSKIRSKMLNFDVDQDTLVFQSPPTQKMDNNVSFGTPVLTKYINDFVHFENNETKASLSFSAFSPLQITHRETQSKLSFDGVSPLDVNRARMLTNKNIEAKSPNTQCIDDWINNAKKLNLSDINNSSIDEQIPRKPLFSKSAETNNKFRVKFNEPTNELNTQMIDQVISKQKILNFKEETKEIYSAKSQVSFDEYLEMNKILYIEHSNYKMVLPKKISNDVLLTIRSTIADLRANVLSLKKNLSDENVKMNQHGSSIIASKSDIGLYTSKLLTYRNRIMNESIITVITQILQINHSIFSCLKKQLSLAHGLNNIYNMRNYDNPSITERNIQELLLSIKSRGSIVTENQSKKKYEQLMNVLPFKVNELKKMESIRPQVIINKVAYPSIQDAKAIHCIKAQERRFYRIKSEINSVMSSFSHVYYDENFLSFVVSSIGLKIRFSITITIPKSYPWTRITIKHIRNDFGISISDLESILHEILIQIPIKHNQIDLFAQSLYEYFCDTR